MEKDVTSSSGSDTIYVRVMRGKDLRPAVGISVTAVVSFTCGSRVGAVGYGPVMTDAGGVAALTIHFAGLHSGRPSCVVVTTHTAAGDFGATTTFVAA
jgi:hypothetical protein